MKLRHYARIYWLIIFGLLALAVSIVSSAATTEHIPLVLAVVIWVLALLFVIVWTGAGLFSFSAAYLIFLGLFHLGAVVPVQLGIGPQIGKGWIYSEYMPEALALCTIAFACFGVGACAALVRQRRTPAHQRPCDSEGQNSCQRSSYLFSGGLGLSIAGVAALLCAIRSLNVFQVSYGELFRLRLEQDPRLFGQGLHFSMLGLIVAATAADRRQLRYIMGLFLMATVPIFLYGFRGPMLVNFVTLLIVGYKKDRRLARLVAIASLFVIMLVSPLVRSLRVGESVSVYAFLDTVSILDIPMEAGASLRPLVATVSELDYQFTPPYWYGRSYLIALRRVLPNLSLYWKAPQALGTTTPAHWITHIAEPALFARAGGMGYSGIAEPYLNFGVPGVVLYFLTLGYFLMRIDRLAPGNRYLQAAIAGALPALLWTTRNDFTNFVRPVVLSFLFVYGIKLLATMRGSHLRRAISWSESTEQI